MPPECSAMPSGEGASSKALVFESSQNTQHPPGFGSPWFGMLRSHSCFPRAAHNGTAQAGRQLPALTSTPHRWDREALGSGEPPALARRCPPASSCLLWETSPGLRRFERDRGTMVSASIPFPCPRWTSSALTSAELHRDGNPSRHCPLLVIPPREAFSPPRLPKIPWGATSLPLAAHLGTCSIPRAKSQCHHWPQLEGLGEEWSGRLLCAQESDWKRGLELFRGQASPLGKQGAENLSRGGKKWFSLRAGSQ